MLPLPPSASCATLFATVIPAEYAKGIPVQGVLIATLGAEPQVVALATQLLLEQHPPLTAVVVVHTDQRHAPIATALPAVTQTFAKQSTWPLLYTHEIPIADVLTTTEFARYTDALYAVVRQWLQEGYQVHLLLAGGRKSMAMLGMSVAQLLLGPDDRVWYLHSAESLRQARTHLLQPGDDVQLIPIPLPQHHAAPPIFRRHFQANTLDSARAELAAEQLAQRRHFVEHELTPAERQVAALVVQEVATVKEIAAQLHKSPKTVTNQLNSIYGKLESTFGLQPDVGVKREFLRRALRGELGGVDWV